MSRSGLMLDRPLQQVRNMLRTPTPIDSASTSSIEAFWTGAAQGGTWVRAASSGSVNGYVFTATVGASGGTVYCYVGTPGSSVPGLGLPSGVSVRAGEKYTLLARVRQTAGTPRPFFANAVPRNNSGSGLGDIAGSSVTPTALGQWVTVRVTATMPTNAVALQFQVRTNSSVSGDTIEVDQAMITPGTYTGELADGRTLGWKWLGATNASESLGYPYTLETFTGGIKPVLALGPTPASGVTTYPFSLPAGESSVTVFSVQQDTNFQINDGFYQLNNTTQRTGRLMAINTTTLQVSPARAGSMFNTAFINMAGGITVANRNIYAARFDMATANASGSYNAGAVASAAVVAPVTDEPSNRIYVGSRDNVAASVVTDTLLIFAGALSDTQMAAISRFLGFKYGIVTA